MACTTRSSPLTPCQISYGRKSDALVTVCACVCPSVCKSSGHRNCAHFLPNLKLCAIYACVYACEHAVQAQARVIPAKHVMFQKKRRTRDEHVHARIVVIQVHMHHRFKAAQSLAIFTFQKKVCGMCVCVYDMYVCMLVCVCQSIFEG